MKKDIRVPLPWIAEKLGLSIERTEFLLKKRVHSDEDGKYLNGFDFFQWVFRYRPKVWTDQHHAFVMECNDILYNSLKGLGIPTFNLANNKN
ncbi:MAG: hypothetical protein K8H85_10250 [Cyclobacteriaceae bacterium]|nr:hypothetical protein [Cyclobacteriaceae bacterium]